MTKLDGIKQPEHLQTVRVVRGSADAAATATQRQQSSQGGNASPQVANAEAQDRRMALIEATNTISSFVQKVSRELRFAVDDKTGRTVITVMDQDTDQVIRQIPEEEVLELARHIQESSGQGARGILINSEA